MFSSENQFLNHLHQIYDRDVYLEFPVRPWILNYLPSHVTDIYVHNFDLNIMDTKTFLEIAKIKKDYTFSLDQWLIQIPIHIKKLS